MSDTLRDSRDCPCYGLLTKDLENDDHRELEGLNHICPRTGHESCRRYIADLNRLAGHVGKRRLKVFPVSGSLLGYVRSEDEYPIRLAGSSGRIILVIRQWIEERGSDDTFLEFLNSHCPSWRYTQEAISALGQGPFEPDRMNHRWLLEQHCLPCGPSTVEYARSLAKFSRESRENPRTRFRPRVLPRRYARVDTFVVLLKGEFRLPGETATVFSRIESVAQYSSTSLLEQAAAVAASHARWVARLRLEDMPPSDLRAINRRRDDLSVEIDRMLREDEAVDFDRLVQCAADLERAQEGVVDMSPKGRRRRRELVRKRLKRRA